MLQMRLLRQYGQNIFYENTNSLWNYILESAGVKNMNIFVGRNFSEYMIPNFSKNYQVFIKMLYKTGNVHYQHNTTQQAISEPALCQLCV